MIRPQNNHFSRGKQFVGLPGNRTKESTPLWKGYGESGHWVEVSLKEYRTPFNLQVFEFAKGRKHFCVALCGGDAVPGTPGSPRRAGCPGSPRGQSAAALAASRLARQSRTRSSTKGYGFTATRPGELIAKNSNRASCNQGLSLQRVSGSMPWILWDSPVEVRPRERAARPGSLREV